MDDFIHLLDVSSCFHCFSVDVVISLEFGFHIISLDFFICVVFIISFVLDFFICCYFFLFCYSFFWSFCFSYCYFVGVFVLAFVLFFLFFFFLCLSLYVILSFVMLCRPFFLTYVLCFLFCEW